MNVAVTGKEVVKSRPQAIACESEISDKKDNIEIARIKRQQLNQLQKQSRSKNLKIFFNHGESKSISFLILCSLSYPAD